MNKDNNNEIILKKLDTNHFSIKLELMNKNNYIRFKKIIIWCLGNFILSWLQFFEIGA